MHERAGQLPREEQEFLLNDCRDSTEMADKSSSGKDPSFTHAETVHQTRTEESSVPCQSLETSSHDTPRPAQYKVYKRRWFGLMQLVLMNIIVSWDVRAMLIHVATRGLWFLICFDLVAIILPRCKHSSGLLLNDLQRGELAEHLIPLRLCPCLPFDTLYPS